MIRRLRPAAGIVLFLSLFMLVSCAKKDRKNGKTAADSAAADTVLSDVSEEISIGLYFDEKGTKRTVELDSKDTQTMVYLIVRFPETMQIAGVEYKLVLPEGVTIESDKFYEHRSALLGTFLEGTSEAFPCVPGPQIVIHALTLNVPRGLTNAELSLMPDPNGDFLGVAICDEMHTMIPASAYKAVINPAE